MVFPKYGSLQARSLIRQYNSNSTRKPGVCFMKGGDSIVLTGKVEIVSDMEIKKALWSDWMFAHFPGGVIDPSYCILKFTSEEATYWIDNEFVKASI